jgi:hypothetical protein
VRRPKGIRADLAEYESPILEERLPRLRLAIRTCRVSFPSQIPIFSQQNRAEAQWRIAALYFVQGWSFEQLGYRYGVSPGRIRQAIRKWVQRAAALGYLQRIPPEIPVDTASASSAVSISTYVA